MKDMQQEDMDMQLWEYIDGSCSAADSERISSLIAADPLWQEQFNALSALHISIPQNIALEQPSMRFSKNVMEAIEATRIAPATKKYINKSIIRGIAAFFLLAIGLMLGYAVVTANWNTTGANFIPKIDFGSVFNSSVTTVAIGINTILALILIDKLLNQRNRGVRQNKM
jgi:hypothetical protein